MAAGAPVSIRVQTGNADLTGKVREVAASSDPITRTYPVKVSLDGKAPPLGATVYATVDAGAASAVPVVRLPTSAFRQDGQAKTVWVLDEASMTVKPQVIRVTTADGNEVVASCLMFGFRVVSAGVHVLPAGVQGPFFNDEFGDVYCVIYALESDGFNYAELKVFADDVRQHLLRVPNVSKVELFGVQEKKIFVEIS